VTRLTERFETLAKQGRKALIPYVTAGDPSAEVTVSILHGLVDAGADVLELGVPFSDPMADGPVIQRAGERALEAGMTLDGVLDIVREFRRNDAATPVVLMGYLNPIERRGYAAFAQAARAAGVDGVLVVDCPPEESADLVASLRDHELHAIYLVSPTSSTDRIALIAESASGYVYYVSLKGITGAGHLDVGPVAERIAEMRAHTTLPVAVGFGISDAESAASVAAIADGVIVGTALVRLVEEATVGGIDPVSHVCALAREMRAAMDE
jgi:tryptophan synthase alpha chain